MQRPLFLAVPGQEPTCLIYAAMHKWLGLLRRADLDVSHALDQRLRVSSAHFSTIAGLVASKLPLAIVLELFESKVDGALKYARWLLATQQGALDKLDVIYMAWARALLSERSPGRNGVGMAFLRCRTGSGGHVIAARILLAAAPR